MKLLSNQYALALAAYLETPNEPALSTAYEIGRSALGRGVGVIDVASVHRGALESVLAEVEPGARDQILAAHDFFVEALAPFEMAHRGYREAAGVLRGLNERLEGEARRIATALHSEVQQLLAAASIGLQNAVLDLPPGQRAAFPPLLEQIDGIANHVRRLSHELRPTILDDLGLVPALEFLADGYSGRGGLPITVKGSTGGRLRPAVETALYRVAQEALHNVVRHAQANAVELSVAEVDQALTLKIHDDGAGFDVERTLARRGDRGLGLAGMRDRVEALSGRLSIASEPGAGTTIEAEIPLRSAKGA